MRRWNKAALVVGVAGCVLASMLFLTTRMSTAHKLAHAAITTSAQVTRELGQVEHIVLFGFRQKQGSGRGYTIANYYVVGSLRSDWVEVCLNRSSPQQEWAAVDLKTGWWSKSCAYTGAL